MKTEEQHQLGAEWEQPDKRGHDWLDYFFNFFFAVK